MLVLGNVSSLLSAYYFLVSTKKKILNLKINYTFERGKSSQQNHQPYDTTWPVLYKFKFIFHLKNGGILSEKLIFYVTFQWVGAYAEETLYFRF